MKITKFLNLEIFYVALAVLLFSGVSPAIAASDRVTLAAAEFPASLPALTAGQRFRAETITANQICVAAEYAGGGVASALKFASPKNNTVVYYNSTTRQWASQNASLFNSGITSVQCNLSLAQLEAQATQAIAAYRQGGLGVNKNQLLAEMRQAVELIPSATANRQAIVDSMDQATVDLANITIQDYQDHILGADEQVAGDYQQRMVEQVALIQSKARRLPVEQRMAAIVESVSFTKQDLLKIPAPTGASQFARLVQPSGSGNVLATARGNNTVYDLLHPSVVRDPGDARSMAIFPVDVASGESFGQNMVVDGDTMAVATGAAPARVYIYKKEPVNSFISAILLIIVKITGEDNRQWVQKARINIPFANASQRESVVNLSMALSKGTLVVGVPWLKQVHVFKVAANNTWSKVATLNGTTGMDYGYSVAIHENRLAVGVPNWGNVQGKKSEVYIYRQSGASWVYEDKLVSDDTLFGKQVLIKNNEPQVCVGIGCVVIVFQPQAYLVVAGTKQIQLYSYSNQYKWNKANPQLLPNVGLDDDNISIESMALSDNALAYSVRRNATPSEISPRGTISTGNPINMISTVMVYKHFNGAFMSWDYKLDFGRARMSFGLFGTMPNLSLAFDAKNHLLIGEAASSGDATFRGAVHVVEPKYPKLFTEVIANPVQAGFSWHPNYGPEICKARGYDTFASWTPQGNWSSPKDNGYVWYNAAGQVKSCVNCGQTYGALSCGKYVGPGAGEVELTAMRDKMRRMVLGQEPVNLQYDFNASNTVSTLDITLAVQLFNDMKPLADTDANARISLVEHALLKDKMRSMILGQYPMDMRYDFNGDHQVTTADIVLTTRLMNGLLPSVPHYNYTATINASSSSNDSDEAACTYRWTLSNDLGAQCTASSTAVLLQVQGTSVVASVSAFNGTRTATVTCTNSDMPTAQFKSSSGGGCQR